MTELDVAIVKVRVLRCPCCWCGGAGKAPVVKGVVPLNNGIRRRSVRERDVARVIIQRSVLCRDCGHSWWTRFYDQELKVQLLLDQQRQLVLPEIGSEITHL